MPLRRLPAVIAVALALGVGGCGGAEAGDAETPEPGDAAPLALDAPAAELRVHVHELLADIVFLTGEATESMARTGPDSELVQAAREEVRKTREELVAELAKLADSETLRERLAEAWAGLDDALFEYAAAQVRTDPATTGVRSKIERHVEEISELVAEATPELTLPEVEKRLGLAVDELLLAMEAVASRHPGASEHLSESATAMQALAGAVAHAIAVGDPAGPQGAAVSEAAMLSSDLVGLLAEEFHLTVVALQVGLRRGFDSGDYKAAARVVDSSARAIGDRIATAPVPGRDEDDRQFVVGELRKHYDLFVAYTKALRGETDQSRVEEIKRSMEKLAHELAEHLADDLPIEPGSLHEPLKKADEELRAAVEAMVHTRPAMYDHIAKATEHAGDVGDVLADGLLKAGPPS